VDDEREEEWLELRRLHDPIAADMTARFLADHGIRVQVLGGSTNALPSMGLTDIRITVPRSCAEEAEEALRALDAGTADDHPFRGGGSGPESYEKPIERKKWAFAPILGFLVPIGAGHFYARHGHAATVLAAGIVAGVLGGWLGLPQLLLASSALVAIDIVTSPFAVKRFNEGRVSPEGKQRAWAVAAVVLSFAAAMLGRHR
jgi:hypothetical protein